MYAIYLHIKYVCNICKYRCKYICNIYKNMQKYMQKYMQNYLQKDVQKYVEIEMQYVRKSISCIAIQHMHSRLC